MRPTLPFLFAVALGRAQQLGRPVSRRQVSCEEPTFNPCVVGSGSDFTDAVAGTQLLNDARLLGADLLVNAIPPSKRMLRKRQSGLCCAPSLQCRFTDDSIPFCYNPESTEFFFADGSSGREDTGIYVNANGDEINLKTGDYRLQNGTTGNARNEQAISTGSTLPSASTSLTESTESTTTASTTAESTTSTEDSTTTSTASVSQASTTTSSATASAATATTSSRNGASPGGLTEDHAGRFVAGVMVLVCGWFL